jgi:hypothetical protein
LLVTYPHEVLIVMAYTYFASGFVGTLMSRGKRPEAEAEAPAAPRAEKDAS